MLTVIIVFLVFSALAGLYDWYVWKRLAARKELRLRGRQSPSRVVEVGSTTGAVAVSSTVVTYRFEPVPGVSETRREVLTSGLYRPAAGDTITVVHLPDPPFYSEIAGNAGNIRSLLFPLIPLNLLWLAVLVAVFLEAFDPGA